MPADLAKRMLAGQGSYQTGPDLDGASELVLYAQRSPAHQHEAWYACLRDADARTIIAAMGGLAPDAGTRHMDAFRDAARAMVEHKLTERMIEKMEALERVSARLGWIAVAVAVVGVVATLVSVF